MNDYAEPTGPLHEEQHRTEAHKERHARRCAAGADGGDYDEAEGDDDDNGSAGRATAGQAAARAAGVAGEGEGRVRKLQLEQAREERSAHKSRRCRTRHGRCAAPVDRSTRRAAAA